MMDILKHGKVLKKNLDNDYIGQQGLTKGWLKEYH